MMYFCPKPAVASGLSIVRTDRSVCNPQLLLQAKNSTIARLSEEEVSAIVQAQLDELKDQQVRGRTEYRKC